VTGDGFEHLSIIWPSMVSVTHYPYMGAKIMMLCAFMSPNYIRNAHCGSASWS